MIQLLLAHSRSIRHTMWKILNDLHYWHFVWGICRSGRFPTQRASNAVWFLNWFPPHDKYTCLWAGVVLWIAYLQSNVYQLVYPAGWVPQWYTWYTSIYNFCTQNAPVYKSIFHKQCWIASAWSERAYMFHELHSEWKHLISDWFCVPVFTHWNMVSQE